MKLSYIIDNILEAKTNLLRNVPRTILTSLGIVIGITSVIILVAITDGAKNIIEEGRWYNKNLLPFKLIFIEILGILKFRGLIYLILFLKAYFTSLK